MEPRITIKSKLVGKNDLRRVTVSKTGLDFKLLVNKLASLYNYEDISNATIKYKDPENDKITIASDEELKEALNLVGDDNILRVFIVLKNKEDAPANTATFAERLEEATRELLEDIGNPALEGEIRRYIDEVTQHLPPFLLRCPKAGRRIARILRRRVFQAMNNKALRLLDSKAVEDLTLGRDLFAAQIKIWPGHSVTMYNLACAESLLGNKDIACAYLRKSVDLGYRNVAHMKRDTDLDNIRNEVLYTQIISELENGSNRGCRNRPHFRCGGRGRGGRGRGWRRHCRKADDAVAPKEEVAPKTEAVVEEPVVTEPTVAEPVEEPKEVEPEVTVEDVEEEEEIPAGITQSAVDTAKDFARCLESLTAMGFSDRRKNIEALVHSRGDLTGAVQFLIAN
mmetsp:Transcript_8075/g.8944  ORF Transcript_8075/g.8944 Transcript_8075/m.8944 type:complete len:397 (-) Transcript_8075:190-1380(-)|eukprot:CAMPEP_0168509932 /NCGR_PEP_ID=MMETSP0405-20121227/1112_1 /TAXON_ID=498012 /ORGANISM="Trichosphaerium sp, Strain Am-I-7 wt" /LENGTH=396 /DNA_ID=CAMNT_0008527569 /DNA_START=40 /DNA_END=1230 /DNA_ORIENTATION=+